MTRWYVARATSADASVSSAYAPTSGCPRTARTRSRDRSFETRLRVFTATRLPRLRCVVQDGAAEHVPGRHAQSPPPRPIRERKRISAVTATNVTAPGHALGRRAASENAARNRSAEHTSELQSRGHIVCRLLL